MCMRRRCCGGGKRADEWGGDLAAMTDVWACVPVKEFTGAKSRLSALLSPAQREILAETMLEDVLSALAGATRLAKALGPGHTIVTILCDGGAFLV